MLNNTSHSKGANRLIGAGPLHRGFFSSRLCHSPGYRMDASLRVLHLSGEHLLDRRNDEIRLLKLDEVPAAGSNDVAAVRGETR